MSLTPLDSPVRIGQLKAEPRSATEVARLLAMARVRLADAGVVNISQEGRFSSAYNAAHAAALAALRWHGYRSEHRFTVFQCLTHTVGWSAERWRVFDVAHRKRNLAEYEGFVEFEDAAIDELRGLSAELITDVAKMTGM
jgi:hypothetical protein